MTTKELLQKENLTQLEIGVMESLISNLYAEPHFSDVDANDVAKEMKKPTTIIRGVLSSLIKKGFIDVQDNGAGFQIIYLREEKFYLHPTWKNESFSAGTL